jgi:arsenite methyltransferase
VADGGLPEELTTLSAWIACIAGARPARQYTEILAAAGLRVIHDEQHDDAITQMISQIDARLRLLRMTAASRLTAAGIDANAVLHYAALARQAVTDGLIGYRLLIAEKPANGNLHLSRR